MKNKELAEWLINNLPLGCPADYISEFEECVRKVLEKEERVLKGKNNPRFKEILLKIAGGKCYYNSCLECWRAFAEEVEKIRQKRERDIKEGMVDKGNIGFPDVIYDDDDDETWRGLPF